jgi:PRTRC genetic system protein A
MQGAGYLIATRAGITGEPGDFFDYVLSGNGLFLNARNTHLAATICIAPAEVRGLVPVTEKLQLIHGKIPRRFYELALATALIRPIKERFVAVTWENNAYHLDYPEQEGKEAHVAYAIPEKLVLDIHSHGNMKAWFSGTDTADDQGFKLSMVIGKVEGKQPEYMMRLCCYGYFAALDFEEVFECGISTTPPLAEQPALRGTRGQPQLLGWVAREDSSRRGSLAFFRRTYRYCSSILTGSKSAT